MKKSETLTRLELCRMIDHTNLKAWADHEAMVVLCREAVEYHYAMVAINSARVAECRQLLRGSDVHVGAAISFPLGQTVQAVKEFETAKAIEDGADEIDYVINIGQVKNGNWDYIRREMSSLVGICHQAEVLIKVIFETCYLTEEEIRQMAEIARDIRPDFIKTSTGFGTAGATVEHVRLMKSVVGNVVKVKAAGGIHTWAKCSALIDAGAVRIGTSSARQILAGFDAVRQ